MIFYNKTGAPVAYKNNSVNIYLFDGTPVAYFHSDSIYGFNGVQLGWFENGWIRDLSGDCILFIHNAIGGPIKPIKGINPIKGIKGIAPIKSIRQIKAIKSMKSFSLSTLDARSFLLRGIQ